MNYSLQVALDLYKSVGQLKLRSTIHHDSFVTRMAVLKYYTHCIITPRRQDHFSTCENVNSRSNIVTKESLGRFEAVLHP